MTIGLVSTGITWLNAFPSITGTSKTISPGTIVEDTPKPNMKYKQIVYGAHDMVSQAQATG